MKRQQSSCWLFCHFTEGQQRKNKTTTTTPTPTKTRFGLRQSEGPWHKCVDGLGINDFLGQVIPVFGGSRQEWVLLVLGSAVRLQELLVVSSSLMWGWWLGLFSIASARDENWELHSGSYITILFFLADLPHLLSSHLWKFQQLFTFTGKINRFRALTSPFVAPPPCWKHTPRSPSCKW